MLLFSDMRIRNRIGIMIETFGSWLDRIPAWPYYRSDAVLGQLNREAWDRELKWRKEHPNDQEFWVSDEDMEDRKRWFGVIGGYGCCWNICRFGIEMQDWWREKEWESWGKESS